MALRSGALDAGYWIDEAIAVGIASHDPGEIPGLLRQDGSPPLYYLLLHGWMTLVGDGEAATRALSLLFAAAAVPAAWWAGGRRAAAIVAVCPFLAYYAQEARMYTLVAVLSLVATAAFVRRRPVILVVALTLLLYTHTWGVFLLAGFAVVWLPDAAAWARSRSSPRCTCRGCRASSSRPSTRARRGRFRPSVLYLVPAAPPWPGARATSSCSPARRDSTLAWLASQLEPAWSPRYLFVLFGPVLLVLARRPAWAVAPLLAAVVLVGPPAAKSNAGPSPPASRRACGPAISWSAPSPSRCPSSTATCRPASTT